MTKWIELREKIRKIYGKHNRLILAVVKFILALFLFLLINHYVGYMEKLHHVYIAAVSYTHLVVAFDRDTNKIKAIGEEARLMLGRTPGNIVAVRPLRQGVISDYTVTEKMIKYFIQKAMGKKSFRKPRISVCVPSGVTEVEKKAVEDATYQAGAREVSIIEEPIAAAIGAGIDIARPCGNMIVDIGGGTSDIAVISLGGSVVSLSLIHI